MVLVECSFPDKIVNLIMSCVNTVNYSLLINGGLIPKFQAKKELRQGDPLSLYLFILVMKYLNRSLNQLRYNPKFKYHPRCDKLNLVHICFVDDLLMCCKADTKLIRAMMQAFAHFSTVSGLQANMEKSFLYMVGTSMQFKD